VFRSTSLRLAALYTAVFALAVLTLGIVTFFATRSALSEQFDARIRSESAAMVQEYNVEGLNGVVQAVHERDLTPGSLDYGVFDAGGRRLAGRLPGTVVTGWSVARTHGDKIRVLTVDLPSGGRLLVGDEEERIEVLDGVVLKGFGLAFAGVIILGVAGGYALSRDVHRRMAAIAGTAEAIIDGDLGRRVPMRGSDDDLDRLAATLNRMLDRIGALMESLKQVSSDVAHDLRTPLTRLRQKLEASLTAPGERAHAVESALTDLDAILRRPAAHRPGGERRPTRGLPAHRPGDLGENSDRGLRAFGGGGRPDPDPRRRRRPALGGRRRPAPDPDAGQPGGERRPPRRPRRGHRRASQPPGRGRNAGRRR
jgi:signal transduction histidine kinase